MNERELVGFVAKRSVSPANKGRPPKGGMMNQRRRLTKLASAMFTLLLLSVAAQKSAYGAPSPQPGVCQIVLCNGLDYTGDCLVLSEGIYDFPALNAIGNDQARSILVGPGTIAELWNGYTPYNGGFPNFEHDTFTADDPNLNDNVIAGSVSSAAVFCDADGDGVRDDQDACPNSDASATIVIEGCDSGVSNTLSPSGCTISDLVTVCAEGARNHGGFVSCVAHLTNDLRRAGIITGGQKGAIQSCAGQSDIP